MEKLQEAEKTTKEIEVLRDGYRPAARRGAVLFFVLADLAAINPMYQYSLHSYLEVFNLSLRKSLPDSHLSKRLRNIINTLSLNVYHYACTGHSTVVRADSNTIHGSSVFFLTVLLWMCTCICSVLFLSLMYIRMYVTIHV